MPARRYNWPMRASTAFALALALLGLPASPALRYLAARPAPRHIVTISIVGTTDLHGLVFPRNGRGGLALLGGYVNNLREARRADGGAVVLVDAGDAFQGGI